MKAVSYSLLLLRQQGPPLPWVPLAAMPQAGGTAPLRIFPIFPKFLGGVYARTAACGACGAGITPK